MMVVSTRVDASKDISCGDERTGVQGYLGKRDNGDADAHEDGKNLGIATRFENVGGYGVSDTVTKHEDADDSEAGVQDVLYLFSMGENEAKGLE
jgi:hypothetical protein